MSLWTTQSWLGGVTISNKYMERSSTFEISITSKITKYWQGQFCMFRNQLDTGESQILFLNIPLEDDIMDYTVMAWWYYYVHQVYGQVEYI